MKYTFAYEIICITKGFVTFNKYARNFNIHNETITAVTPSHAILHIYIYEMKSVTRKCCSLRYTHRRSGSTKEMKLTPHNKTDVQR